MIKLSSAFCSTAALTELYELAGIFSPSGLKVSAELSPDINGIHIKSDGSSVYIRYSKEVFLYRALGLISEHTTDSFEIKEESRFDTNGIMFDCSRNAVLKVNTIRKFIRQMALMGLDMLMLYTEDTYEIEGEAYFGYLRGRYTADELREIVDYAGLFGIEVVPCIQTLAHLAAALKWYPYGDIRDTEDILLPDEEKTYSFIERMIAASRKYFKSRRIHIGMDEAEMLGRGVYYEKHGDNDRFELMCRHLGRIIEICQKYDFSPMIWSDMFFKHVNNGDYHGKNKLPPELIAIIPDDVSLVYWDYYRDSEEEYDRMIKNHLETGNGVAFAGGAWKFRGFAPSVKISMERTGKAYNVCAQNGIRDVFITSWGDNGSEASQFSVLPVYQMQAELGFYPDVSEKYLSKRLKTCTGACLEDFYEIDMPELEKEKNDGIINPHRYMLFQDILMGLYDYHVRPDADRICGEISKRLESIAKNGGEYAYIFETLQALYGILELKAELGIKLKKAYDGGDMEYMRAVSEKLLPEMVRRTEIFRDRLEKQWMCENKPFGFDAHDMRLGALIQRFKTVSGRISRYLSGEDKSIPELEEERLPLDNIPEGEPIRCDAWSRIVTASWI